MGDKYLYMQSKNKYLPYLNLINGQYIFVGAFKDSVRKGFLVENDFVEKNYTQLLLPIASFLDDNYFINSEGIIEEVNPCYKHCGAKKYSRKGYNWKLLYLENGMAIRVKVKRYKCKKCGKKFQVEFPQYWDKFCNFWNKIKDKAKSLLKNGWKSLRNIGNDFQSLLDLKISHETIRKSLKNDNDLYWLNEEIELSGYYAFDTQWIRINRKWVYRLTLFDIINNMPVACLISEKETPKIPTPPKEDNIFHGDFPKTKQRSLKENNEDIADFMWGNETSKSLIKAKKERKIDAPVIIFILSALILMGAIILLLILK